MPPTDETLLDDLREWKATGRRYLLDRIAVGLMRLVRRAVVRGALKGRPFAEEAAADALASIWAAIDRRSYPEFESAQKMRAYFSTLARARGRGAMAKHGGSWQVRKEHAQGVRSSQLNGRYGDPKSVEDRIFLAELPEVVIARLRAARSDWSANRLAAAAYAVRCLFQRRPLSMHTLSELYGVTAPEEVALVKTVATVRARHALRSIRAKTPDAVLGCRSGIVPEVPR